MELYSCRIIDMEDMEEGAGRGRGGFAKFLPFPLPNRGPEKVRFTCLSALPFFRETRAGWDFSVHYVCVRWVECRQDGKYSEGKVIRYHL